MHPPNNSHNSTTTNRCYPDAMGRRHLLYLLYTSFARPPSSPPYFIVPPPPPPPPLLFRKGYCRETISHERAPSTLEEFKRLEEEKAGQRIGNRTVEKGKDGDTEVADTSKTGGSQSTK
ncbi:uncharacterized protein LOC110871424 [Helianthus annuus]|nr:uncharacterized protein LOC110871424 [Helianthus annuus]